MITDQLYVSHIAAIFTLSKRLSHLFAVVPCKAVLALLTGRSLPVPTALHGSVTVTFHPARYTTTQGSAVGAVVACHAPGWGWCRVVVVESRGGGRGKGVEWRGWSRVEGSGVEGGG